MLKKALVIGSIVACLMTSTAFADQTSHFYSNDGSRSVMVKECSVYDVSKGKIDKMYLLTTGKNDNFQPGDSVMLGSKTFNLPIGGNHLGVIGFGSEKYRLRIFVSNVQAPEGNKPDLLMKKG